MTIYTYVVYHDEPAPNVTLETKVNGGKLLVVSFSDLAKKVDDLEDLLRIIANSTSDARTEKRIDDYFELLRAEFIMR